MEEKILEIIKRYNLIENGDKIVVGVSGGPDSITLLNILKNIKEKEIIKFNLVVCHINHMIREEAVSDEKYVEEYCKKNNIEFFVKRIKVEEMAEKEKIGTEEAGRKARYEFFNEILNKTNANKIATAHTANDNAETVLMNIIRGSGTLGLKGIEAKSGKLIRPLIECKRSEIEKYCKDENLNPRIDKTNFENIYTRNKVRNMLIPYIENNFNPNIIEAINRLSDLSKQENDFLEKLTKEAYEKILVEQKKNEIILDLNSFNSQEIVIKNRLVLYTINILFGTRSGIEKKHIEDIIKLCSNNIGNKFLIPNKKVKILVKNKKIFFIAL
jgi:tRNA(Ile)-lysidine synthase